MNVKEDSSTTAYAVPPVERAIKLLRYIGDNNTCRNLSTAASDLSINRTTLIRLIHTLLAERLIEELGDGRGYRLGVGLVTLGAQAIAGRDLVQTCQPVLQRLCEATSMSAHFGILDGTDIVYLSRVAPNSHLVSNIHAGARLRAHASSIGRAILAQMAPEEITALLAGATLEAVTPKTPTTIEGVIAQADADRALGYAWSVGNFEAGIGSCGAAVFDHVGRAVGALNVSGPDNRFADPDSSTAIIEAVCKAAAEASALLGAPNRA
ncbi:IclR family transcriptional regulator [Marivita sp. S6314]|uniref:IclR family transcriptional regulator n=1 Tax=Marivita sp. S6314 TaxID=2926406 RepID=UPI001FF5EFC2|nr:IclR family transcriptional regulator [Marivita sp. S6314]MCK0150126.1 IclR family transcriptional regulator [Marivita sp. S6314]